MHVRAWKHPFRAAHEYAAVEYGSTLTEILLAQGFVPEVIVSGALRIAIDGHPIPQEHWHRIRPKAGRLVTVRLVPLGGGGGKNPLRTILQIAVVAAAVYTGGLAAGASGFAAGSFGFAAVKAGAFAGTYFLGSLAVNAIAPPPTPQLSLRGRDESQSATLRSLTGAGNQANPYGPIPRVYGRMRVFPPYAAQPYTETAGDDQYLNLLFCFGYGPLVLSDLRIGDVPLAQFEDVEVEIREGRPTDAPLTLYRNDVAQEAYNLKVTASGGSQELVTGLLTDEAIVDLTFDGLIRITPLGSEEVAVEARVEYRRFGTSDPWTAIGFATVPKGAGDVTFLSAPGGEWFSDWRTAQPTAGSIKLTLTCPVTHQTSAGVTRLWGIKYRIFTKAADQGDWKQVYASPDWLLAGQDTVVEIPGFAQRQTDIRVQVLQSSWYTNTPALAANGGGFRMAPNPKAWEYVTYARVDGVQRFSGKTQGAVRRSVRLKFPATGRYSVRVTRITPDRAVTSDSQTIRDELYITGLSSVRYVSPVSEPGMCLVALRIRATDQLSGVIDRFSGVAQTILPVWTGSSWVERETRNPAWAYADILRGRANGRALADSRLDLNALKAWADACDSAPPQPALPVPDGAQVSANEPYWTFDGVFDFRASVFDALKQVAATARASFAVKDGRFTIVRDMPQSVPVQHFTPRNSIGFSGSRTFNEVPHGLKVRFLNERRDYAEDEIAVYRDGYGSGNASRFETLELFGVTRPAQAWREGRYHLAAGQLRPDTYSLDVDIEHLAATAGDLVRVSHDVVSWGQGYGRIKSADPYGVFLDTPVTMQAGSGYAFRFRLADGRSSVANPVTVPGEQTFVPFASTMNAGDVPAPGDLFLFGLWSQDSQELLVREIQPQRDLSARLILIDAAPLVHQADRGAISLLDGTASAALTPPAVSNLRLFEEVEWLGGEPLLVVKARWAMPPGAFATSFDIYLKAGDSPFRKLTSVTGREVEIARSAAVGDAFTVRIVAIGSGGVHLPLSAAPEVFLRVTTDALAFPPPDVTGLRVSVVGDTAHFTFSPVSSPRLSYYEVRFTPTLDGATWNGSTVLLDRLSATASGFTVPAMVGTTLIKAVNTQGVASFNAALVTSDLAGLASLNVVATVTESPAFAGIKTGCGIGDAGLRLTGNDTIDGWTSLDAVGDIDTGLAGLIDEGIYTFAALFDLGAVYTSRLTALLEAGGAEIFNKIDSWPSIDAISNWDGNQTDAWRVALETRTTNDDPTTSPAWSEWRPFVIGDYTARAFQFRARLYALTDNVTPMITGLSVQVDMPDRIAGQEDIVCPAGGLNILYPGAFKAKPALAIAAQDMATGDTYTITAASASGFTIQFRNSSGAGVARTFDYLAKGYGRVH